MDTYGTPEHEAWLMEMDREDDAPVSEAERRREEGWDEPTADPEELGSYLRWGQRVKAGHRVEPYYDVTIFMVPVTAPVTDAAGAERVRRALYGRWANSLTGWSVGGYSTPRVNPTDDPFTVEVEQVYHIGD